ncbi:hypothetical protein FSW04_14895 [Baekduia soli]|uniref:Uncharacterized protein n=1 Tax=Baekduia soli TaxID=496014 RepID=A0A5B8U6W4_9ACTN|nr:hypothetical protein [Baekduia soli]QEC48730.1 hypothetical protein FSW04_14895 [Baekduia soli]
MADAVAVRTTPVREIRAFWRVVQAPPSLLKRLEPFYYVAITLAIGGPFVYGTASSALAEVATPRTVATWGPALALAGLLALVRWGAVQGPVIFSVADVAQLLGAPLRRAELVLGRLARGLLWGAGGAAVVAAIALIGIAGHHRSVPGGRAAAFVAAVALLGVLGMAGASLVQGSRGWDRATRLAGWPVLAAAAGLVVLGSSGATGRSVALWSGPWGWAVAPVAAGRAWPLAPVLLAVATAGAVGLALARRGRCPTERHMLRAEARGGAVAALYSFNARYVGRSLRAVSAGPTAGRGSGLRAPRSPRLAILWRDAVAALAAPQRLGEAIVLAAGGTVVCLLNAGHPAAVAGGALATYVGASRLLEPLRAETDRPNRVRVLLREPMGRVLTQHAVLPALVVLAAASAATAGVAIAGALPRHGGAIALLAVAATPSVTLCAALSSRRGGQMPTSLMSVTIADTTGMSGGIIVGWIVAWPLGAVALGTVPVSVVAARGTHALPTFVLLLAVAPAALVTALGWERFAP